MEKISFYTRAAARLALMCAVALPCVAHQTLPAAHKLLKPHVENRVLVKKKPVLPNFMAGIGQYLHAKKVHESPQSRFEVIDFSSDHAMAEALFLYGLDPSVEIVEPDYLIHACDVDMNDPIYPEQWGLSNDPQDVDINAPLLWEKTAGDSSIIVAVLDTGVDFRHRDLAANMWQNVGETPNNSIDDDKNGFIDDVYGVNVLASNGNTMDDNGHGSHVAGIIAAVGNNNLGISGVMHSAQIVSCKFLDDRGRGTTSDSIKCLDYIFDLKTRKVPVNIVATNNSWATGAPSAILHDAIKQQEAAKIAFITAADNYGLNNDFFGVYPANYNLSNVISVAAIDQAGKLADFSNFGQHSVHVAAPGVQIQSTVIGDRYEKRDGTSMAAPFVTGLFGIISHYFPENSLAQNKNLLISSQKPLTSLARSTMAGGILRAADELGLGAISCQDSRVFQTTLPKKDMISSAINQPIDVQVLNINCADPNGDFNAVLHPAEQNIAFFDDGSASDLTAHDGVYSASFTPFDPGAYELDLSETKTLSLEVYDSSSWHSYRIKKSDIFIYTHFLGTKIPLGDDDVQAIKLPFKVPFAQDDVGLSHIYIGSNGTLSLSDHEILNFANTQLPVSGFVSVLAPLWLDLDPSKTKIDEGVFYQVTGDEPHRRLVVEWRNIKHRGARGKISFEIILQEDSFEILYSYRDLNFNDISLNGGKTATIGVQVRDMAGSLPYQFLPISDGTTFILTDNISPVADAGPDASMTKGQSIQLDGSKSHDHENSEGLRYEWTQLSGLGVSIDYSLSARPTITALRAGVTVLSLKVTDDGGASATDTITVTIAPSERARGQPGKSKSNRNNHKKARKKNTISSGVSPSQPLNTAPAMPEILEPKLGPKNEPAPAVLILPAAAGCSTRSADTPGWAFVAALLILAARLGHKKVS